MQKWSRLNYQPCLPLGPHGTRATESLSHRMLSKRAAAEGAVLLKNEDAVLPLKKGTPVAIFGKGCADYVKGGGGSGDVTVSYVKNLLDGLRAMEKEGLLSLDEPLAQYYESYVAEAYAKGIEPGLVAEAAFPLSLAEEAQKKGAVAILAISRFSGENWDRASENAPLFSTDEDTQKLLDRQARVFERGDFYLSEKERMTVEEVKKRFSRVIVVLNVGGVVDVSWIKDDDAIQGALLAFQGGMEGGTAIAELLCGLSSPSGRLSDTYAKSLSDYPSSSTYHDSLAYVEYQEDIFVGYRYFETIPGAKAKVVYPFGYGLSYTSFSYEVKSAHFAQECSTLEVLVKNTGAFSGKEVLELYVLPPRGKLGKPRKVLASFAKTPLLKSGEEISLILSFSYRDFASYDEEGVIKEASWVLEKGEYRFVLSDNGPDGEELASSFTLGEDLVLEIVRHQVNETLLTRRLQEDGSFVSHSPKEKRVESILPRQTHQETEGFLPLERPRAHRVTRAFMAEAMHTGFLRVAEGEMSLEEFISTLPVDVLIDLVGGQPNRGVADTYGFGNQEEYGIPSVMTADGPAGLRITPDKGVCTTAWPCSTLLASSWDKNLAEEVGQAAGLEVKENNIGLWLTPAVNIHRSPLCGRNFEYYSEDPLLCGIMASSLVKGVQSNGIGACAKHFACNNKETNRKDSDSRVSERALREIYLKQFEIIVKRSQPLFIMTSYNIVNGVRAAENKELITGILREDWGFEGAVCSDWWNHSEHYLELLAGEDLKMGNGFPERVKEAYDKGAITRRDLEANVKHILSVILRLA